MRAVLLTRVLLVAGLAFGASACDFLPDTASPDSRQVQRHVLTEEELVAANAERHDAPAPAPRAEVTLAAATDSNAEEALEPDREPVEALAESDLPMRKQLPRPDSFEDDAGADDLPGL